jgi:hypothetical protein
MPDLRDGVLTTDEWVEIISKLPLSYENRIIIGHLFAGNDSGNAQTVCSGIRGRLTRINKDMVKSKLPFRVVSYKYDYTFGNSQPTGEWGHDYAVRIIRTKKRGSKKRT